MAESYHDKLLGVEMGGITWADLSHPGGAQYDDCRWIETEEVDTPSLWTITLYTIKEGAMAGIQQMLPEKVAMTICGEALTPQRDRSRLVVAPERRFWV